MSVTAAAPPTHRGDMGRRKVLDYDRIVGLYEENRTVREVAAIVGCRHQTVTKIVSKRGVKRDKSTSHLLNPKRGKSHHSYKTGLDKDGYPKTVVAGKRQLHHRQIASRVLGRPLSRPEVVHHCNETRTDNRPENLWVFPNQSAHLKYHATGIIHPDTIFLKDYL